MKCGSYEGRPADEFAWRLHIVNWFLITACAATLVVCLALTSFSLVPRSFGRPLAMALIYTAIACAYARLRQRETFGHYAFASAAQIVLVASLMAPLGYIAAAIDLPMQDEKLALLDRILGLDWPAYFRVLDTHRGLIPLGHLGYGMIIWPGVAAPFILAANAHYLRLQQFIFACIITLLITFSVSAIVPAVGTYQHYGIHYDSSVLLPTGYTEQLRDLPLVRAGALRTLDLGRLAGIATFPSFHASAALLFIWVFWPVWWMRPITLITNGLMLLATPIFGGHYFSDVFAGLAVAWIAIAAGSWATRRLGRAVVTQRSPLIAAAKIA